LLVPAERHIVTKEDIDADEEIGAAEEIDTAREETHELYGVGWPAGGRPRGDWRRGGGGDALRLARLISAA
jgi:hypothetical protein